MEQQVGLIARVIGGVVGGIAIVGSILGIGKYNASVVKKNELYKPDGRQIYLTVAQSHENIKNCQEGMAKELEGVNTALGKISKHLVITNEERVKTANLMGRIEQYMENNKGGV